MSSETTSATAGGVPDNVLRVKATQAYAREAREALEERLILENLPMVRHIVQKVTAHLSKKVDVDDLISAGTLGLVKAAKGFDLAKDVEFRTYAYIRVRGAVIDEIRGRSFAPSSVHNMIRGVEEAFQRLSSTHGRPPSDEQLAEELGIGTDDLYQTLQEARRQHFMSIHGLTDDQPALGAFVPPDRSPSPEDQAAHKELLEALTKAIRELPERDRIILLLYYERDLTMKETAKVLGITESRVSQLHASAVFKLAMKLRSSS